MTRSSLPDSSVSAGWCLVRLSTGLSLPLLYFTVACHGCKRSAQRSILAGGLDLGLLKIDTRLVISNNGNRAIYNITVHLLTYMHIVQLASR